MNMKINTSPNAKIIFSILLVVAIIAASTVYVIIPQNEKRIEVEADIEATRSEIDVLRRQKPDLDALNTIKAELENKRQELESKMLEDTTADFKRVGTIDTSVSNITALLGGMAESLSIKMSRFQVVADLADRTEYDVFMYGSYHDISTFLQVVNSLDMTYEINRMFLQPVVIDDNTDVPIPVPGATTPPIPTATNIVQPVVVASDPSESQIVPEDTNNGNVAGLPENFDPMDPVGSVGSVPENPSAELPTFEPSWTFGEGTDIIQETPLFDPVTGQVLESIYSMGVQASFKLVIFKNANGTPIDVVGDMNVTPTDPFSEDRTPYLKGRFGYNMDYMGDGKVGTGSFNEKIVKLITDDKYRQSEIVRTRAVIDNRKNAGLDISAQLEYLTLLININIEVERGKHVDRASIIQNFAIPTDESAFGSEPNGEPTQSDKFGAESPQQPGRKDEPKTIKLESTMQVHNLSITLHSVQINNVYEIFTPENDTFLIFDVTLENVGNDPEDISKYQTILYDAGSYTHDIDYMNIPYSEIDVGKKMRGKMVFDVELSEHYEFVVKHIYTSDQSAIKFQVG